MSGHASGSDSQTTGIAQQVCHCIAAIVQCTAITPGGDDQLRFVSSTAKPQIGAGPDGVGYAEQFSGICGTQRKEIHQ